MPLAHGNYSVELKGNIIWVVLDGAFNEFAVENWINEVKAIVNALNGKPFTILMEMSKALGATPESFELSNQYNAWLNKQNMTAKALIYGSAVFEDMDKTLVPSKQEQNIRVFDDIEAAQNWLQQQLALID
jgi:hypothetical protein